MIIIFIKLNFGRRFNRLRHVTLFPAFCLFVNLSFIFGLENAPRRRGSQRRQFIVVVVVYKFIR